MMMFAVVKVTDGQKNVVVARKLEPYGSYKAVEAGVT